MSIWIPVSQQTDSRWIMSRVFHLVRSQARTILFCYHIMYLAKAHSFCLLTHYALAAILFLCLEASWVLCGLNSLSAPTQPAGITEPPWMESQLLWEMCSKAGRCVLFSTAERRWFQEGTHQTNTVTPDTFINTETCVKTRLKHCLQYNQHVFGLAFLCIFSMLIVSSTISIILEEPQIVCINDSAFSWLFDAFSRGKCFLLNDFSVCHIQFGICFPAPHTFFSLHVPPVSAPPLSDYWWD